MLARRRGLVVKAEDSCLRGHGLKLRRAFFSTFHLDQKPGVKIVNLMFQPTWHCCICSNPGKWKGGI